MGALQVFRFVLVPVILLSSLCPAQSPPYGIGRPATPAKVKEADITIFPNGRGLPPGQGTAERGRAIFKEKCAECHNEQGEGRQGQYPALTGGKGSLATDKPVKTVGSFWPFATTLWDSIHRSMPYDNPRSLSADDVYAVTAFVLYLNGIVKISDELNAQTLPQVRMPNRDGFIRDARPDIKSKR
jgi:cytochrome c